MLSSTSSNSQVMQGYVRKMAEEDEIDVLGDFSLDNLLSKNETGIYGYDDWLVDNHDYSSNLLQSIETGIVDSGSINSTQTETKSEHQKKNDSDWTDQEKQLLDQALEIFEHSPNRISQFIGTKSPSKVKQYLKSYQNKSKQSSSNINDCSMYVKNACFSDIGSSEIVTDSQIPALMEEVIDSVSTAKPTVPDIKCKKNTTTKAHKNKVFAKKSNNPLSLHKRRKSNSEIDMADIPSGHSILKKNAVSSRNKSHKMHQSNRQMARIKNQVSGNRRIALTSKMKTKKRVKNQPPNYNAVGNLQLVTGEGLSVPVSSGEEVIKIKPKSDKDSDSDIEIDIDGSADINSKTEKEPATLTVCKNSIPNCIKNEDIVKHNEEFVFDDMNVNEVIVDNNQGEIVERHEDLFKQTDSNGKLTEENSMDDVPEELLRKKCTNLEVLKQLLSTDLPAEEYIINHSEVTDMEKYIHGEFFEGRPTKTPERYLKIRNHILNNWYVSKPAYVTKTSVRSGLKNCGDVNTIGRVHHYLEQIGAINFGCSQIVYKRPLSHLLIDTNSVPSVNKTEKNQTQKHVSSKLEIKRPRKQPKYLNNGEGGYTLAHGEDGEIIDTVVVNHEKVASKPRYTKKQPIKLIACKNFSEENLPPYQVKIHVSALLSMDWHAHTAHSEVMGLLGGSYTVRQQILYITRYIPCRSATNSATHCDMCPVSQAKAHDKLQSENLAVVGWFHSHPTFSPNPSQQDVDTQMTMQGFFSNQQTQSPFVGLILSPFLHFANSLTSDYRCLIVDQPQNTGDSKPIPYKFQVDVTSYSLNISELMNNAQKIFSFKDIPDDAKITFSEPYFRDPSITYLDKIIASTKFHLSKCCDINKMMCDSIVQGISDLCSQL